MEVGELEGWEFESLVDQIKRGKVFIYPTDTVYGLGGSIHRTQAIDAVYEIKDRPADKPVPVLATRDQVEELAELSPVERQAAEEFWPGNLTLVLKATAPETLDDRLLSAEKIALREPDLPSLLELISNTGPIVGTSANLAGQPAARELEDIPGMLMREVDFILGEKKGSGAASTVAEFNGSEGQWTVHREGEIAGEQLPE